MRKATMVLLVTLAYAGGAASLLVYEYYDYWSFAHIEIIKRSAVDDQQYQIARQHLGIENPDFIHVFRDKTGSMTLQTKARRCYFFYKKSGVIWEGGDLVYCFDRLTGAYLGPL